MLLRRQTFIEAQRSCDRLVSVFVLLIVLTEQILAVVVSVGRAHDHVNVLAVWHSRVFCKVSQISRQLMIKLYEDHRTVNAIVEHAGGFGSSDPGEPCSVEMLSHFLHPNPRVTVVHV